MPASVVHAVTSTADPISFRRGGVNDLSTRASVYVAMRQYPHQFDRAQEVVVQTHAPVGRLPLVPLAMVATISTGFWVSLAHGLGLL